MIPRHVFSHFYENQYFAVSTDNRKYVTRSKTGSLTPRQFTDSITVKSGSLKTALSKLADETVLVINKEGDITRVTRSMTKTNFSQQSAYFKLGEL